MIEPISVFVNIYHPAYLGGTVYTITKQDLYESQEKALIAAQHHYAGELLHSGLAVSFLPEMDEHPYEVPKGYIVSFMNIIRPELNSSDPYASGQSGLYSTAEAAKEQADRIRKGYYMSERYIAAAVPVVFKGLPMTDGWARHDQFNYSFVHREERTVVD